MLRVRIRGGGASRTAATSTLEEVSEEDKAPLIEILGELQACVAAVG